MSHKKIDAAPQKISALALHGVTVLYEGVTALDDLTMVVKQGDQIAIVGPNGAGKSTLFNVITGLVKPTMGRVDVYGGKPDAQTGIAYVPQRSQIDWRFPVSVFDVVLMGRVGRIGLFRWARAQDRTMAMDALRVVDMVHLAKRQIGELSGGQQQRVFLARALAQEAHLLLLDEPLAGLDIPNQEAILRILGDLQMRGVTMLVATHDLSQAAEHFAQVLLLNRRLIACGAPAHVLTHEHLAQAYGSYLHIVGHVQETTPLMQPNGAADCIISSAPNRQAL